MPQPGAALRLSHRSIGYARLRRYLNEEFFQSSHFQPEFPESPIVFRSDCRDALADVLIIRTLDSQAIPAIHRGAVHALYAAELLNRGLYFGFWSANFGDEPR